MFLNLFMMLKEDGFPVGLNEYLNLLEALDKQVIARNVDQFYYLCRTLLVKHEQHLDRFDVLFARFYAGFSNTLEKERQPAIPEEWLRRNLQRLLSEEEKAALQAMGGLEALIKRLNELLNEQDKRHEAGNTWIGSGGTSPFGAGGYNPEGIRPGGEGGSRKAVKIWQQREYRNLDHSVELNTRNIKMVLRRLRILSREGRAEELDIDKSIRRTSENAGLLELAMVPSRRNNVKVLLFFDIGGSMDEHVETCTQLFAAARYEFKHMEFFYFHNCIYENVWKDNSRRRHDRFSTYRLLNTYNRDYKVVIVGDASMSPYELHYAGGSIEHMNEEPGITWLQRLQEHFEDMVWLNPLPVDYWNYTPTIQAIQDLLAYRMFPLSLGGLFAAMKTLQSRHKPGKGEPV